MAGKSISRKLLLAGLVFIVVIVFFTGFGIATSIQAKLHSAPQSTPSSPGISGSMSIYFLSPSGEKVPIGTAPMALVFKSASGKTVSAVAGTLSFDVKNSERYSYDVIIYIDVEQTRVGSGSSVPIPRGGSTPMAIVPLAVTPGGPGTAGSVDEYKIEKTGTGSAGTVKLPFKVSLGDIIKNPRIGDEYKITVYAFVKVTDQASGATAQAYSDKVSFTVSISENSGSGQSTASIELSNVHIEAYTG